MINSARTKVKRPLHDEDECTGLAMANEKGFCSLYTLMKEIKIACQVA